MALVLNSVDVVNDGIDGASYKLVIKDGDKTLKQTGAIDPGNLDGLANLKITVTDSLTLIAVRV